MIKGLIKGDTINFECKINSDISDWKIRCELYDDKGESVKLATENSGGSDDQIDITDEENGEFLIKVAKNTTTNFDDKSYIEVEIETATNEIFTPYQDEIIFKKSQIDWESPS